MGVSNFDIEHLDGLRDAGCPTPSVNQLELHVYRNQKALVEECGRRGITVMGYSPLVRGQKGSDDPVIMRIAKK